LLGTCTLDFFACHMRAKKVRDSGMPASAPFRVMLADDGLRVPRNALCSFTLNTSNTSHANI
jgi:hypothetical protein